MSMSALPADLARIVEAPVPRFSDGEMARRRASIEDLLKREACDHLIFCGANRFGSAVQWLTQWPVTAEAVGVLSPGERDALFVQHVNHAPQARLIARDADVDWGGESSMRAAIKVLDKRASPTGRIAYIGPLTAGQHAQLSARFPITANLTPAYTQLAVIGNRADSCGRSNRRRNSIGCASARISAISA
jgi:Xaa-Pro dipeptidase